MAQIKDEKNDTSINNGPNAHHGPNINHKPKEEFHGGGGRGGRGNRFQPYGGPNRDRKGGPRDNNMVNFDYNVICVSYFVPPGISVFFFEPAHFVHGILISYQLCTL